MKNVVIVVGTHIDAVAVAAVDGVAVAFVVAGCGVDGDVGCVPPLVESCRSRRVHGTIANYIELETNALRLIISRIFCKSKLLN